MGRRCFDLCRGRQGPNLLLFLRTTIRSVAVAIDHPVWVIYNATPRTLSPPSSTRQNTMTPNAPDDDNVLIIHNGQISPGCPTADAILDGYSGWRQPWSPAPTLPHRASFGPVIPPTPARNPWTSLRDGSYVLFQLDKREYARQLHVPEGSESFECCLAFPTRRYVGLVLGTFSGNDDDSDTEKYLAFVGKSLPPGSGSDPERNSFAIPINPTEENTNGRHPLCPRPFPWTGCYQYTVLGTMIARTHVYPSAIRYELDGQDFELFEDYEVADRATLSDYQRHGVSSEEAQLFESMRVSGSTSPLPVKVWQELTAERECHDPREFLKEVSDFGKLALGE